MALKYQRILLKISGEALGGEKGTGFDEPTMDAICGGVKKAHELGVQIGIVVGGGNFWRGRSSGRMERTLADKIGMLATVMNALAVSDKLEQLGVPYDKDPHKYPDAKKYETLTFTKVLEDRLAVMDGTAATLCRDNKLPILVFDLADPDNIARAVQGENVGTLVYEG